MRRAFRCPAGGTGAPPAGEARWLSHPIDHRDLRALTRKLEDLPEPHDELELALWNRGGAAAELDGQPGGRMLTPADMV